MPIEPEGDLLHSKLAQLRQFVGGEEVLHGRLNPLGRIDFARLQQLAEVFGREIDVNDLVGDGDDVIGYSLLHADAGGPLDDVVQTFQVLDVERGDDADADA